MGVDPFLLSILVCPKCHGSLTLKNNPDGLVCSTCSLLFPVKDDIPVMLIEEAIPLESVEGRQP